MSVREVVFTDLAHFQDKQMEALSQLINVNTKYLLYGGAAAGGKSYFLRWVSIFLGMYYTQKYGIAGVPIGLFSEDYPTLRDRQISKIKREFPDWLGSLKETQDEGFIFKSNPNYGDFSILLRNLDDPSKYFSTEFAAICVDELTRNTKDTFDDLRFRMRFPGIADVKFVAATNPGGVGHSWVKKLWIEPDPQNPDIEQNKFTFVPAKAADNKYVDEGYITQLKSLPDQKRKAFLDGSWDIFSGQVLSEWSRETHVIEPFDIPKDWYRFIGLDWGVNKPFAVVWVAQSHEGRAIIYRELYMNGEGFENLFKLPLTPKRLARAIKKLTKQDEQIEYIAADPSMWNNAYFGKGAAGVEGGESIAEVMESTGLILMKGDNDRINGLARFRDMLSKAPDGKPWLQVFSSCYNVCRTLPALVYDRHRIEDVNSDGEDHLYDSIRYWIMSRPPTTPTQKTTNTTPLRQSFLRAVNHLEHATEKLWDQWGNY